MEQYVYWFLTIGTGTEIIDILKNIYILLFLWFAITMILKLLSFLKGKIFK